MTKHLDVPSHLCRGLLLFAVIMMVTVVVPPLLDVCVVLILGCTDSRLGLDVLECNVKIFVPLSADQT